MASSSANPDWRYWFERWQAMQNCYVIERRRRFELMLARSGFAPDDAPAILDLGCGPGALSLLALERFPKAHVVAVDFDALMLEMGRHVAAAYRDRIEFVQADLRDTDWWEAYAEAFDLVVSSTALHWLSAENLARVFRRVFHALRPGGWFFNSDHVASDDAEVQTRNRQQLEERQAEAFRANNADTWRGYWEALERALDRPGLVAERSNPHDWEGTDDGQPERFFRAELRACGFENVELPWRELGEAVVGATKPDATGARP
jgi:SAM-dependent methyltransferase